MSDSSQQQAKGWLGEEIDLVNQEVSSMPVWMQKEAGLRKDVDVTSGVRVAVNGELIYGVVLAIDFEESTVLMLKDGVRQKLRGVISLLIVDRAN